MSRFSKLKKSMKVGKKIFTMNPFGHGDPSKVTITCKTITEEVDKEGRYKCVSKSTIGDEYFHQEPFLQDNLVDLKYIGFTAQGAKRALARYQASLSEQAVVHKHHNNDSYSMW